MFVGGKLFIASEVGLEIVMKKYRKKGWEEKKKKSERKKLVYVILLAGKGKKETHGRCGTVDQMIYF